MYDCCNEVKELVNYQKLGYTSKDLMENFELIVALLIVN